MATSRIVNRRTEIAEGAGISDHDAMLVSGRLRGAIDTFMGHVIEHGATGTAIEMGEEAADAAAAFVEAWPRIRERMAG